jgi:NAD(P)-dependent dehydrogenase (short-subunit alcohol dehydrogenase family)
MGMQFDKQHWGLVLGGSSGMGLATAKALARRGMNVAVVHRDRKGAMSAVETEFNEIRQAGVRFVAFNLDALSDEGRKTALDGLAQELGEHGRIRMLMHSIAFGNLKPLAPADKLGQDSARGRARLAEQLGVDVARLTEAVNRCAAVEGGESLAALAEPAAYSDFVLEDEDFGRTVYSMGTSLATWTQDLFQRRLFAEDARVLGMTSEGNEVAWRGYAAVSAAKVALESVARSIALEFAPYGIRANVIQAGVTDTPALRLIPGSNQMKAAAKLRNPFGRLTLPSDVADVACLLCTDEARWINGTIIRVDGGEHISG